MAISGKKGIFFTITAVLLSAVIIAAFLPSPTSRLESDKVFIDAQIGTGNDIINQLTEAYGPAVIRSAGFHAVRTIAELERHQGAPFTPLEVNTHFPNLLINGSMNCPAMGGSWVTAEECVCNTMAPACPDSNLLTYMKDKNVRTMLAAYESTTEQSVGVDLNFSIYPETYHNINLFQSNITGPFALGVNITFNYTLVAPAARWQGAQNITILFDAIGLEDPLYSTQAPSEYRIINRTSFLNWNVTQVWAMTENKTYRYAPNGSSYLMRLTGVDQASDCCGIESFIDTTVTDPLTIPGREQRPYVDWCILGQEDRCPRHDVGARTNLQQLFLISCLTTGAGDKFYNFTLDSDHIARYNLTTVVYQGDFGDDPMTALECDDLMAAVCLYDPVDRPAWLSC